MNTDEAPLLGFAKLYKFETTFKENGVEHKYISNTDDVVMGGSGVEEGRRTELWRSIRCIGSGAFGSVWLQGRETSVGTLKKIRAVKIVLRGRTTAEGLRRELHSLIAVRDVSIKPSRRLYLITPRY